MLQSKSSYFSHAFSAMHSKKRPPTSYHVKFLNKNGGRELVLKV